MKRLEDVQIGDEVVVRHCAGAGQEMIEYTKVIKVTKTQITVEKGKMRFLKRNGYKVGECKKKFVVGLHFVILKMNGTNRRVVMIYKCDFCVKMQKLKEHIMELLLVM